MRLAVCHFSIKAAPVPAGAIFRSAESGGRANTTQVIGSHRGTTRQSPSYNITLPPAAELHVHFE